MQILAHNLAAQFTNRQLNISTDKKTKSSEKLSSGYRINRSADDAAGLQMSEKMRSQIRGLNQASENIQDGISLCQVADGALVEVQKMLQRVNELSIQSSNDTNTIEDRTAIQNEIGEILKEINRVSDNTEFNTQKIFKGNNNHISSGLQGIITRFAVSGSPIDDTQTTYNFNADITTGLSINGTTYPWNQIYNTNGQTLDTLADGKYTITNNGIDFSFEINGLNNLTDIVDSLKDVSVTMSQTSGSSIKSATDAYNIPFHCMYHETYQSEDVYTKTTHTLTTDADGITLDNIYKVKWSDVYPPKNSSSIMKLNFSQNSGVGMLLNFNLEQNCTLDDLISGLNGVTFNSIPTGNIITQVTGLHINRDIGQDGGLQLDKIQMNPSDPISTFFKLPTSLFTDQGYDINNTYINKKIEGDIELDLTNVSNSNISFSIDGSKKTSFKLDIQSQNNIKKVMNNGGILKKGDTLNLLFENNGGTIPLQIRARNNLSLSDIAHFYNTNNDGKYTGCDLTFDGAFSQRDLDIENFNFGNGSGTSHYSFNISGFKNNTTGTTTSNTNKWWIQTGFQNRDGWHLKIDEMDTNILGINDIDVTNYSSAQTSIANSQNAINIVSQMRTTIGAQQNRLEHAKLIDDSTSENTQNAESRIRDIDMANEMVNFSKNNILEQFEQAMMAQANQSTQNILSLLN